MSGYRQQALIEAPLEPVWELLRNPARHPEWWPRVVEVHGDRFEQGDTYRQVTRMPGGSRTTTMEVHRLQDLRELRFRCLDTGTYAHWQVTAAQGGTFVDVEFGIEAKTIAYRVFELTTARRYFRRWLEESLEALAQKAPAGVP
jgi:uncharacterized protein YndB with AHSA1/START domain